MRGVSASVVVYNSCGDRHCPQCAGAKRRQLDRLGGTTAAGGSALLSGGLHVAQGALSSLALGNRRVIYDLLFHAAWAALKETIEDGTGLRSGSVDGAAYLESATGTAWTRPCGRSRRVVRPSMAAVG